MAQSSTAMDAPDGLLKSERQRAKKAWRRIFKAAAVGWNGRGWEPCKIWYSQNGGYWVKFTLSLRKQRGVQSL